jgi:hypothetical protein
MESKTTEAYRSVFRYIRDQLAVNFRPEEGYSDFEAALINALIEVYQLCNLKLTGCWFHFAKVSEILLLFSSDTIKNYTNNWKKN